MKTKYDVAIWRNLEAGETYAFPLGVKDSWGQDVVPLIDNAGWEFKCTLPKGQPVTDVKPVVGNKVTGEDDLLFLKEHIGDDLLAHYVQSSYVRAQEQGREHGELESHNRRTLDALKAAVDARTKDWAAFQRHAVEFHLRNAAAWANAATGHDLSAQVDPEFRHGPEALTTTTALT